MHRVSQVRKVICEWLAWVLRMSRPMQIPFNPPALHEIIVDRTCDERRRVHVRMSRPGRSLSRRYLQRKARMRELTARSPPSMSPGVREGAQGTMCQVRVRTPKAQDDQEPAFDEPRAHEGSKESCVRWSPDPQV